MSKLSEILIYYLCIGSIEDNAICVDFVAEDKKKEKKEVKMLKLSLKIKRKKL